MRSMSMPRMRSKAPRVTRPEGPAAHQSVGIKVAEGGDIFSAASMKPAIGILHGVVPAAGVISFSSASPSSRPGQVSAAAKSCQLVGVREKVLVSCWKPPIAMRMDMPLSMDLVEIDATLAEIE